MNNSLTGLIIASLGYLFLAVSGLVDKFLVTKTFRGALEYTFWLAFLSLGFFILLPFQFVLPRGIGQWAIDLIAGGASIAAVFFYMKSLEKNDASTILPVTGVMATLFTGLLAFFILDERLNINQILALAVLLAGFWLLTSKRLGLSHKTIVSLFDAALFFAISNVAMKLVLSNQPLIAGMAFSRLGSLAVVLSLLIAPGARRQIFASNSGLNLKKISTASANGLVAAAGLLMIALSYKFTSPTIVNAIQGVQYGFLFIFALLATHFWPKFVAEQVDDPTVKRKIYGIALVGLGLVLLVVL